MKERVFIKDGKLYRTYKCVGCGRIRTIRHRLKPRQFCSSKCYNKHMIGKGNPFYGKKHSKITIKKLRNSKVGKPSWNKGVHQWKNKNHPRGMLNKNHSARTIRKIKNTFMNNPALTKNARINLQRRLIKNGNVMIGINESQILDEIELSNDIKIDRQYIVCGYFLDGYCRELNLAVEVDDRGHNKPKKRLQDKIREQNIKNILHCNFVRVRGDF